MITEGKGILSVFMILISCAEVEIWSAKIENPCADLNEPIFASGPHIDMPTFNLQLCSFTFFINFMNNQKKLATLFHRISDFE